MRRVLVGAAALVMSGLAACSSINEVECIADEDCPGGQICTVGECQPATSGGDVGQTDTGSLLDASGQDVAESDGGGVDTGADADAAGLLDVGVPCSAPEDCESGICVEASAEMVCSTDCDSGCPDDWTCRQTSESPIVELCFPPEEIFCEPCSDDSDCLIDTHVCNDFPDGDFCIIPCADACPQGTICEVFNTGDDPLEFCVPESGVCSACFDEDDDGFGVGEECDRLEIDCAPEDDSVFPGATESCNGIDDDCDGETDEDFDFSSVDACGGCGNVCGDQNADATCESDECQISCFDGFFDCDEAADNGCEADVLSDPSTCGDCDTVCEFDNALPGCDDGDCFIEACEEDFFDLNREMEDGCECEFLDDDDSLDLEGLDENCDGTDGDVEDAVYVASVSPPDADGLSPDSPVASIEEALEIADRFGRDEILVTFGAFEVNRQLIIDRAGIQMVGGYDADFAGRGGALTVINSTVTYPLRIEGVTGEFYFAGFRVVTPNAFLPSFPSVGIALVDATDGIVIEECEILVGNGAGGANGRPGNSGGDGPDAGESSLPSQGRPGGGTILINPRRGGDGASGVLGTAGSAGADATTSGAACGIGGAGGERSGPCDMTRPPDDARGGDGERGCDGEPGVDALGGNGIGSFVDGFFWVADVPQAGTNGEIGGGGGGGGAGGGSSPSMDGGSSCVGSAGGGGGGGGAGGDSGRGGSAGGPGGASIGLLLARSEVTLINTTIVTGSGGSGGAGGPGGDGGAGGSASAPGTPPSPAAPGGRGGNGGQGGRGGCGGAGGGGPSVGVFGDTASNALVVGDVEIELGAGGVGGPPGSTLCSDSTAGDDGLVEDYYGVEVEFADDF